MWIVFGFNSAAFILTWHGLKKIQSELQAIPATQTESGKQYRAMMSKRMMAYVFAFIISWLPSTINRMYQLDNGTLFSLQLLMSIFSPLRGFIDFIVFMYTRFLISQRNAYNLTNGSIGGLNKKSLTKSSKLSLRKSTEIHKDGQTLSEVIIPVITNTGTNEMELSLDEL